MIYVPVIAYHSGTTSRTNIRTSYPPAVRPLLCHAAPRNKPPSGPQYAHLGTCIHLPTLPSLLSAFHSTPNSRRSVRLDDATVSASDDAIPRTLLWIWDDELEITRAGEQARESMHLPERKNRRILSPVYWKRRGEAIGRCREMSFMCLGRAKGLWGPRDMYLVPTLHWGDTVHVFTCIDCTDYGGYCIGSVEFPIEWRGNTSSDQGLVKSRVRVHLHRLGRKMSQSHGVIGYRTAPPSMQRRRGSFPGRRGARHLAGAE